MQSYGGSCGDSRVLLHGTRAWYLQEVPAMHKTPSTMPRTRARFSVACHFSSRAFERTRRAAARRQFRLSLRGICGNTHGFLTLLCPHVSN